MSIILFLSGIESKEIGSKLKSIVLNDNNQSGTRGRSNSFDKNECCLSESQCRELADIALEVHKNYGDPRDIEWGIKDNKIYLLQSRPITNLDNWTEWEAMHDMDSGQQSESEYFSRANLGEVFPGASSHLCLSWTINCWNGCGFVSQTIIFVTYCQLFLKNFREIGEKYSNYRKNNSVLTIREGEELLTITTSFC